MHLNNNNSAAIYNRTDALKERLNSFISRLTASQKDYFEELSQEELISLKSALSDVNNVLTLKTTLAFADWLCEFFNLDDLEKNEIYKQINSVKPNTNGFDIEIDTAHKIVIEIKCIIPINNGNYYGAAQRNSILDDAIKLKNGKKSIPDTADFFKLIGLIDLGEKTDIAIQKLLTPSKTIRTTDKSRLKRHEIVAELQIIDDTITRENLNMQNVFIKKIKLQKN